MRASIPEINVLFREPSRKEEAQSYSRMSHGATMAIKVASHPCGLTSEHEQRKQQMGED